MNGYMEYGNGYVLTKKLNLDLKILEKNCDSFYEFIKHQFAGKRSSYGGQATLSTNLFREYNLLMYSYDGFYELYEGIRDMYHECFPEAVNNKSYIQCWLNYYQKGEFINWHRHWPLETRSHHGYFCVSTETVPSSTSYRIRNYPEVSIPSEDNLLVMSPSGEDLHKSSEWTTDIKPRITIAFDIIPREFIKVDNLINHWVPI